MRIISCFNRFGMRIGDVGKDEIIQHYILESDNKSLPGKRNSFFHYMGLFIGVMKLKRVEMGKKQMRMIEVRLESKR